MPMGIDQDSPLRYKSRMENENNSPALKNPHAQALGKLGGSRNTQAQNQARAQNARLGGWPKGRRRKIQADESPQSETAP